MITSQHVINFLAYIAFVGWLLTTMAWHAAKRNLKTERRRVRFLTWRIDDPNWLAKYLSGQEPPET